MPYIASNGELYDDEEIFVVKKVNQDEELFQDYKFLPADEIVMLWEKRMCL
jgi:hypothetical protein